MNKLKTEISEFQVSFYWHARFTKRKTNFNTHLFSIAFSM